MLALTIIALFFIAAWHFIWDGIIAPALRAEYRFQLFEQRDRLRELKYKDEIITDRYRIQEESINTAIKYMGSLSITSLYEARARLKNDKVFRELIEQRKKYMDESPNVVIKDIMREVSSIMFRSFMVNIGGWMIYLVPAVIVISTAQKLTSWVERFVAWPEKEADKLFSHTSATLPI